MIQVSVKFNKAVESEEKQQEWNRATSGYRSVFAPRYISDPFFRQTLLQRAHISHDLPASALWIF